MKSTIITLFTFVIVFSNTAWSQPGITGKWVSAKPEITGGGYFIMRQFDFKEKTWQVEATLYLDSLIKIPVFRFRAFGDFELQTRSEIVENAYNAVFRFDKKFLTLCTRDSSLRKNFRLDKCNLIYLAEKEITVTGCGYYPSKSICGQEYDLVYLTGTTLFLGERPASGGMCDSITRPKKLGFPLKRIPQ